MKYNITEYILQPLNIKNLHSNLWTLEVSFIIESLRNYTNNFSSYGDLVFFSDPIKLCSQENREKYKTIFCLLKLPPCATLKQLSILIQNNLLQEKYLKLDFRGLKMPRLFTILMPQ